jgi:hypothetical protein
VCVGREHVAELHANEQVHRDLVEVLRVVVGALHHPHARCVERVGIAQDLRAAGLLHVGVPRGQVEVTQRAPALGVAHDDDAPALAIAAARREPRIVEHAPEDVDVDWLVAEQPARRRAAHRIAQVHRADASDPPARSRTRRA